MSLSSLFDLVGVDKACAVLEIIRDVGFRFDPAERRLMSLLNHKMSGNESEVEMIPEVDVCKYEPWDLPDVIAGRSKLSSGHAEWFCFSTPDYKYRNSSRVNRATDAGYWKSTGRDRRIKAEGAKSFIGTKKILVFYEGRFPNGMKTRWVIHEFRPETVHPDQMDFVLCRLMKTPKKEVKTKQSNDDVGYTNNDVACNSDRHTPQYPVPEVSVTILKDMSCTLDCCSRTLDMDTLLCSSQVNAMMQESQELLGALPHQPAESGFSFSTQPLEHNSGCDAGSDCAVAEENQDPVNDLFHKLKDSELLSILLSPGSIEQGLSPSDVPWGNPMIQENQESLRGSWYPPEGNDLPSIVQSAGYYENGLSLSDLELPNDLAENQGQGRPLKDLVGNEGRLSRTIGDSDNLVGDKTESVSSLFGKDYESRYDSSSVIFNDSILPESLMIPEEAKWSSKVENETPVGIYPPNDTGGYISSST